MTTENSKVSPATESGRVAVVVPQEPTGAQVGSKVPPLSDLDRLMLAAPALAKASPDSGGRAAHFVLEPPAAARKPTSINRLTHRLVRLQLGTPESGVSVRLIRSLDWLDECGARPGGTIWLDMGHMGAEGPAEVLSIDPCPEIKEGDGQVITGTFAHTRGVVYDLKLAAERQPIGVTATHPFWSMDRNAWVSAIDLEIGETLKTLAGTTLVERTPARKHPRAANAAAALRSCASTHDRSRTPFSYC